MGYGCFLPRAGYAAFFERKIPARCVALTLTRTR